MKASNKQAKHTEPSNKDSGMHTNQYFNTEWYSTVSWLCGCLMKIALICLICILFDKERSWRKVGMNDITNLSEKIAIHESSKLLIKNETDLAVLGNVNIGTQLDTATPPINFMSQ
jgi:hypothetical protein